MYKVLKCVDVYTRITVAEYAVPHRQGNVCLWLCMCVRLLNMCLRFIQIISPQLYVYRVSHCILLLFSATHAQRECGRVRYR